MKQKVGKISLYTIFTIMAVGALTPIVMMVINSFKTSEELARNAWRMPELPTFGNYTGLMEFNSGVIQHTFMNSLFVSIVTTVLTLLISSLAAYAFAKFTFKGKNILFMLLLASMMIPGEITLPAIYLMFSKVGMLNTYSIQILPGIANVFNLFLFKQYMESVPSSVLEAAIIDGATPTRVYWNVMMPMVKPVIGSLAILTFLNKWNDYLWPSMLLTRTEVMPIMVILPTLNVGNNVFAIPWNIIMAGCAIVTLPLIVVFIMFQEQFMASVAMGAVKE